MSPRGYREATETIIDIYITFLISKKTLDIFKK
jgi:hypothetical protein